MGYMILVTRTFPCKYILKCSIYCAWPFVRPISVRSGVWNIWNTVEFIHGIIVRCEEFWNTFDCRRNINSLVIVGELFSQVWNIYVTVQKSYMIGVNKLHKCITLIRTTQFSQFYRYLIFVGPLANVAYVCDHNLSTEGSVLV